MGVSPWAAKLLRRKPAKLVAVALAKKAEPGCGSDHRGQADGLNPASHTQ